VQVEETSRPIAELDGATDQRARSPVAVQRHRENAMSGESSASSCDRSCGIIRFLGVLIGG
jgi:hypothetical protein